MGTDAGRRTAQACWPRHRRRRATVAADRWWLGRPRGTSWASMRDEAGRHNLGTPRRRVRVGSCDEVAPIPDALIRRPRRAQSKPPNTPSPSARAGLGSARCRLSARRDQPRSRILRPRPCSCPAAKRRLWTDQAAVGALPHRRARAFQPPQKPLRVCAAPAQGNLGQQPLFLVMVVWFGLAFVLV